MARRHRDSEFSADLKAAARRGPRGSANVLFFTIAAFFVLAIVWASRATVDEVTTGQGRIIPSGEVQVVLVQRNVVAVLLLDVQVVRNW